MVRTLMSLFTPFRSVVPETEQRGIAANRLLWQFEDPDAAQLSDKFWQPGSVRSADPREVLGQAKVCSCAARSLL